MQEREHWQGRSVGIIMTGGNIDPAWFAEILLGLTPQV